MPAASRRRWSCCAAAATTPRQPAHPTCRLRPSRRLKTNLAAQPKLPRKREPNELPPDARFRIESIASEKRIAALVVADLNGDGRPDIAYYGEPKELVVLYNQGTNGWSAPKRWPIEDGQLSANALATGDLNGDGRPDLGLP